jgi:putative ABC transport system permease protein
MLISDLLHETYAAVTVNKVRSGLTILGIVIGIASVVALTAIGTGAQGSIQSSIQSIGSNLVMVMPGATRGVGQQVSAGRGASQTLLLSDSDAILANVNGIAAIAPEQTKRYQVTAKGTNTNTSIIGTVSAYPTVRNVQVTDGSFITDSEVAGLEKVAVLGPTTRDDLFGVDATDAVGSTININKIQFTVIGVTKARGGTGFSNQDDNIYIPITTAQRFLSGNTSVTTISIEAVDQKAMAQVQQDVTTLLLQRHNISDPTLADFNVLNQSDIVAAASAVTNTFTILLASIAGISLLVGGIGIMNMMLTNVTERTREIGLRKAIGAQRKDISRQFLVEAVMLTFLGGAVGVALGWIIAWGATTFAKVPSQVSLESVALAFGVSAAIGVLFGWYPARRASGLNPIEALRFE